MNALTTFASILLATLSAAGHAQECKETQYGKCFTVRGRYNIYVDGDAIWIVGTHRRLETTDSKLDKMLEDAGWQEHSIFGDFVVCPESQFKPGHLQSACIQSYKNIHLKPWR